MYTHTWGIPYGWHDRLRCETVLDSSVSNRGSYFYMGGRTRSPDLVYGRHGNMVTKTEKPEYNYPISAAGKFVSKEPGYEDVMASCLKQHHGYITKFNEGKVNSTKFFHP
jgi:hypothetical protein